MLCACLGLAFLARADPHADRTAIRKLIDRLNAVQASNDTKAAAGLFTADAQEQLGGLDDLDDGVFSSSRPWSELTAPFIVIRYIRFVTSDVAIVDGVSTQFGSTLGVRRVAVMILVKKEPGGWRIAWFRVLEHWRSPGGGGRPQQ